jgi:hypothetical protein
LTLSVLFVADCAKYGEPFLNGIITAKQGSNRLNWQIMVF